MKNRQVLLGRGTVTLLKLLGEIQRVRYLTALRQFTVYPDLCLMPVYFEYGSARQTDNGVATPLFTALHRFKKIGVRAFRQFPVGTDRRFKVGQYLGTDGYTVVVLCRQRGKVLRIHGVSSEREYAFSGRGNALATIASR